MPAPRIHVTVGLTLPAGSYASRRIDLTVERDVGSDYMVDVHALRLELEKELDDWKSQHAQNAQTTSNAQFARNVSGTVHTPVSTKILTDQGTIASVTEQMIEAELDQVNWIDNSKRTGWFAPLIEIPQPIRDALINKFLANQGKSVRIGGYNYTRFGEDSGLLGKFPIKETKQ